MNKYIKSIFCIFVLFLLFNSSYADAYDADIYSVDIYENCISKENYDMIINLVNKISMKINEIDKKLDSIMLTEEYENYPTVRLNVSTPFFGINSIIDSKLKINNNVSLIDIISGYNIRDVINKKIVKVPVLDVGGIIVITKDIKIEENMNADDSRLIIPYLFDYLKQVNDVSEFCDNNISNIFKNFFIKDKRDLINEYFDYLNDLDKINTELNSNISYVIMNSSYNSFDYNEYIKYMEKYDYFFDISKNVFATKENIISYIEDIKVFKEKFIEYNEFFIKEKENIIDYISSYEFKSEDLLKFVDDKIKYLNDEIEYLDNFVNNKQGKINEVDIYKRYVTNSEKIIDYLKRIVSQIEEEKLNINEDIDVNIYDEDNNEIDIYTSKDLISKRNDRYFKILNIINNYTLEFASYEVGFYFNNIRNIYRDIDYSAPDLFDNFEEYEFMYVNLLPSLKELEYDYVKGSYLSNLLTIKDEKFYLNRLIKISEDLYKVGVESVK